MAGNVDGFYIVLTRENFNHPWAVEVSALANAFMENGFQKFADEKKFCYALQKKEIFFERRGTKGFPILDEDSWCRYSEVEDITSGTGGPRYVVDFRKGIDGKVKKFGFGKKPTDFQIESVCHEPFGLVKSVQCVGNEYHFFFEASDENDEELKALIELEASLKDYSFGDKKRRAIVCTLKDRTEDAYGVEVYNKMYPEIRSAFKVFKKYAREKGYRGLITNPYVDAHHIAFYNEANESGK